MTSMTQFLDWLVETVHAIGFEGLFQRFYGSYPGIVEDVVDPERRGRVRIRILALGQKRAPGEVWAKPIAFGGSEGTGIFWAPSRGDQVWVQFEAGQPSSPVFLGGFMGAGKAAPEFAGDPLKRGLKTPAGHWVRFSDHEDDEHVTVRSAGGSYMTMDHDGNILAASKDGSYLRLSASGTSLQDASGSIAHMEAGKISLTASDGSFVSLDGGQIDISGSASCSITVSGNVAIKGGSVDLGAAPAGGVVIGPAMAALWMSHTHMGNLGVPTGIPLVPMVEGVHYSRTVKGSL